MGLELCVLPLKHSSYVLFLSYGLENPCFSYFTLSLPAPLFCRFYSPPPLVSVFFQLLCAHFADPWILRSLCSVFINLWRIAFLLFYVVLFISSTLYSIIILCGKYHLSLPNPVPLHVQAVGGVSCFETKRSDRKWRVTGRDKTRTVHDPSVCGVAHPLSVFVYHTV